jgi:UPF0716 protein FxsA
MFVVLILLFLVVPIVELYLIIQVGQAIGVGWTIVLLVADAILGSMLLRHQGRAAWRRFNAAIAVGQVPAREALDGALVIFGGALLLTPGFLTDILGLVLLVPPTRAVVRRILVHRFADRMIASAVSRGPADFGRPPGRAGGPARPTDVEGTASDIDADGLPRGSR